MISWVRGKTQILGDMLRKALMFDRRAMNNVFCYMLGALPQVKLPTECESNQFLCFVLRLLVGAAWQTIGVRARPVCSYHRHDGQVNMASLVYDLQYDASQGEVVKVTHRRSGHEVNVDADLKVTSAFHLKDGWSDSGAVLSNGKQCHYLLHQFFDDAHGPDVQPELKGNSRDMDGAARHAQAKVHELETRVAEGRVGDGGSCVVAVVCEEKKRARAEEALEEVSKRRRVAIVSATT